MFSIFFIMKRIVVLILCVGILPPCSFTTSAQTNEQRIKIAGDIIKLGSYMGSRFKAKKSEEIIEEAKRTGDPYADCYYITNDGSIRVDKECKELVWEMLREEKAQAREQAREQERIELENKKLESERQLQEMREANVDPFIIDCYWIDEEGNLSLDQSCLEWKIFASMEYVDLGLPSGTLWGAGDMMGFYTYHEASGKFGSQLPSKQQFEELRDKCTWSWLGGYCKITGPNGNCIYLIASGHRDCSGDVYGVGTYGYYWSSTPYDSDDAWRLFFDSSGVNLYENDRCNGHSVRLVQ